jgi:3-phenylpropionate/trans-cinnamate dioxygenase subunit alpha
VARRQPFNVQMGLGHATSQDAEFPGTVLHKGIGEEAARGLYRRWADLMTGASWSEIDELVATRQKVRALEEAASAE